MTIDNALEQFVYGIPIDADVHASGSADILAITAGLSNEDAILCRSLTTVEPMPLATDGQFAEAVGLFKGVGDNFILARATYRNDDRALPVYRYVLMPQAILSELSGNIKSLVEITEENLDDLKGIHQPLEPVYLPPVPTLVGDKRATLFARLRGRVTGDLGSLLVILDMALSGGVQIAGYPQITGQRIDLIESLMLLLPMFARRALTFTTYSDNPAFSRGAVLFSDQPATDNRQLFSLSAVPSLTAYDWQTAYAEHLYTLWQGDVDAFIGQLRALDAMATRLGVDPSDFSSSDENNMLEQIARQHALDMMVLEGEEVSIEAIKTVVQGALPSDITLLAGYVERLMIYALENRDTDVAKSVASLMDENPALDEKLNATLENYLQTEPDAVYSFIRTHLSTGVKERWLPRLNAAATISLDVAINNSDGETLISWLRLLGREPGTYQLGEVLQRGILAAQRRTHEDGKLGMQLLTFAVKRAHSTLEMLLEDEELIAALADPLGSALRDYNPDAVYDVLQTGRELALILLYRAVIDQKAEVFDDIAIAFLWQFYTEAQTSGILPRYQPGTILDLLIKDGGSWLTTDALSALLVHLIEDAHDNLFLQVARMLLEAERLFPLVMRALGKSEQSPDVIINLVNGLINEKIISQQQAVEIFVYLLDAKNWDERNRVLVDHMARFLGQNAPLQVTRDTLWKMLGLSHQLKSEIAMRIATRRLVQGFTQTQGEMMIVNQLHRIYESTGWSGSGFTLLLRHWREFINGQALAQLQQIARVVTEDGRLPDEVLSVVTTTIAIRKVLGKRTLQDFAEDVGTAYTIMQLLSDSFDPNNKQSLDFDQETVRTELDTHEDELTPNERNLLAKNLKELAQLVILMADNRSKSSLIRREGNIERQLLTGEQSPQSAIDTMKWLSGYLSGMQNKDDSAS